MEYSRLRSTLTHLLLLKEMQIVSTCIKGKGHSMTRHRRHRGGSTVVVLLVLNGVVNDRLRPLYAWETVPVPIVQEAWSDPERVWMGVKNRIRPTCTTITITLIYIRIQKFIFLSLFSINIFCII